MHVAARYQLTDERFAAFISESCLSTYSFFLTADEILIDKEKKAAIIKGIRGWNRWIRKDTFMNNRQLEYFVETVRLKSFTKAANKLFVTQSALSKAIACMETELDTTLIDREARDFRLTRDGETVFDYATEVLAFFEEKTRCLYRALEVNQEKLSVGLSPTSGAMYFSSVIYHFEKEYPESELVIKEVTTDEGILRVLDGTLDMSVVIEPFEHPCMEKVAVLESEAVLLVSKEHPLADRACISLSEIVGEPIAMVGKEYRFYDFVMDKFREIGCEPTVAIESNRWEFVFEMVSNNQGISILPRPLIEKFHNSRVKQIQLKSPDFRWGLSLIRRKDRPMTIAMENFWELCNENAVRDFMDR